MLEDRSLPAHVAVSPAHRNEVAMPRPPHVKPPAYLTPSPPVPEPEKVADQTDDPLGQDPTRYGDWTLKGIAVDF
jgi:hypothetical protein